MVVLSPGCDNKTNKVKYHISPIAQAIPAALIYMTTFFSAVEQPGRATGLASILHGVNPC